MTTKICKWTREKGSPKDFLDPTRKSHMKFTQTISVSDYERIKELAKPHSMATKPRCSTIKTLCDTINPHSQRTEELKNHIQIDNILDNDELLLHKRISNLKKHLSTDDLQQLEITKQLESTKISTQDDNFEQLLTDRKNKLRRSTADKYYHPLLISSFEIDDADEELNKINERRKYVKKMQTYVNNQSNFRDGDRIKMILRYEQTIHDQEEQRKEKAKMKNEEKRARDEWDENMRKDVQKSTKEKEEKFQEIKETQKKMKSTLDQLCKEKKQVREDIFNEEKQHKDNIQKTNEMYQRKKQKEFIQCQKSKEKLNKMHLDDLKDCDVYNQKISETIRQDEKRDLEFSVFKRAFGRKVKQHIRHKMAGNPGKQRSQRSSSLGSTNK